MGKPGRRFGGDAQDDLDYKLSGTGVRGQPRRGSLPPSLGRALAEQIKSTSFSLPWGIRRFTGGVSCQV